MMSFLWTFKKENFLNAREELHIHVFILSIGSSVRCVSEGKCIPNLQEGNPKGMMFEAQKTFLQGGFSTLVGAHPGNSLTNFV